MPTTVSVGLTKKCGQPSYGSIGASCSVEFELDGESHKQNLDAFRQSVKNAYIACAQAVHDELARQQATTSRDAAANGAASNGRATSGNISRHATDRQLGYARQLARQVSGLGIRGLETVAEKMYDVPLASLTSSQASGLIDMLKEMKAGRVSSDAAFGGMAFQNGGPHSGPAKR